MGRRDSDVGIGIHATNNASGPIDAVRNSLRGLETSAGGAVSGLGGLGTALSVAGLVAFAGAATGVVMELSNLAAASQTVGNSFDAMASKAGAAPAQLLASLKQASAGTISEYNLMLAANKAMLLGVADSADEMGALMAVAQSRGRAMGLSVTQAFNDLVTGLGRVSPLILDNLGITVDLERVNSEYAASIGKTAASLTEQERKQALVNKVMEEAGTVDLSNVEGMASSFERAQASIADMKVALGELFGPAVAAVAETLANAIKGAVDLVQIKGGEEIRADTEAIRQSLTDLNAMKLRTEELWAQGVQLDWSATEEYIAVVQEIGRAQGELNSLMEQFATRQSSLMGGGGVNLAGGSDAISQQAAAQAAAVERLSQSMSDVAVTQQIWQAALQAANGDAAIAAQMMGSLQAQYAILTSVVPGATGPMYTSAQAMAQVAANAATSAANLASMAEANADAAGDAQSLAAAAVAAAMGLQAVTQAAGASMGALGGAATAASIAAREFAKLGGAAQSAALQMQSSLAQAQAAIEGAQTAAQGPGIGKIALQLGETGDAGAKAGAAINYIRYMSPAAAIGVGSIGQAAGTANQEFQSLQSTISSLLEGQLDPGVGVNVDSLLPREDAINENARRLADIAVNGFKGQDWLEEFKAEVPDIYQMLVDSGDPKTSAAQLLRDFQDGLVPELIDKEAAKERVRRMLTGDANMAQMAQEIATELSQEMGVSLQQAQQAAGAALGTGGAPGGAGAIIDGNAQGGAVVDGLTKAIAAKSAQIQSSGGTAGSSWLTGFLGQVQAGIGGQLLAILAAALVGPVGAALAAEGSRKGAD